MLTPRHILTIAVCVLPLAACRSGYDVDVRNMADQPVVASLITTNDAGSAILKSSARLGPGDRTGLYAETDTKKLVWLEVDFAGNVGYPARLDLQNGRTVVNVHRADEGSKGKLNIQTVAH